VVAGALAAWQVYSGGRVQWIPVAAIFGIALVLFLVDMWRRHGSAQSLETATRVQAIQNVRTGSKLNIHRAVYAAGLPTEVSVTDKLQNFSRDGIVIQLDATLGGLLPNDPAYGVIKRLDVEYSYGSDTRFHISRIERPPGEVMRLVLPEDTEVQRLQMENQALKQAIEEIGPTCAALQGIVKEESEKIQELIRQFNQRIEFHFSPGCDPYLDVITELWNGSVFDFVSFGEIRGHGSYGGKQLAVDPRLCERIEPVLVNLKHGKTATLTVRQFISTEVADSMVANLNRGVLVDFETVAVPFKALPKFMPPFTYTWWGPKFTMDDVKRI
jgi:hypothetical protein